MKNPKPERCDLHMWTALGVMTTGPKPALFGDPIPTQFSQRFYRAGEKR